MNHNIAIQVSGVSKKYKLYTNNQHRVWEALLRKQYHREFYALKNINLSVKKGEILGIIGRNGSGKSTLLKIISGILTPTTGQVHVNGKVVPLLELGSGLHPDFTGVENIFFYTAILGYPKKEITGKVDEIIEFADIGDHIDQPMRTYSSGMKSRLAFSVSVNIDPDILILDEILSVGDGVFSKKSNEKLMQFFHKQKTILFVSHATNSVKEICSRVIILDRGEIIMDGDNKTVTDMYEKLIRAKKERAKVREEIFKIYKG